MTQWIDAARVAEMINDELGTQYQGKHAWSLLRRAGVEPHVIHGYKRATPAMVQRFLRWKRAPRDRVVNTTFTINATAGTNALPESEIERNRRIIAQQEAMVRAGKLLPVYVRADVSS